MAKRYKGKYVAQIEIDIDIDAERPGIPSFDEIKESVSNKFTPGIKDILEEEVLDNCGTVTVTQQYADTWEVEVD